MRSKILSVLMVLVIVITIFAGPLAQKTQAVVVSSVVVGSVLAVMAMAGITVITSGMTAAELHQWVSDKLEEWADSLGQPLDNLINAPGIGMTISGIITIGTAAAQGISQFISWLQGDLGLTNQSIVEVIPAGVNLSEYFNITAPAGTSVVGNRIYFNDAHSLRVYLVPKNQVQSIEFTFAGNLQRPEGAQGNGFGINCGGLIITGQNLANCHIDNRVSLALDWGSSSVLSLNISGKLKAEKNNSTYPQIVITGSFGYNIGMALTNIVLGGVDVEESPGVSVGAGTITIPQVTGQDKVFLDVGALPGTDIGTATEQIIEAANTGELTVQGEVAEELPPFEITGPVPVYGLKDVFPFCIPFDLYDFVSCLAADPVAPHFEWRLYVEDVVDYTFVIDLQQFETVAQIFRTMFLLAFIVGLAMVTRHLMRS